MKPDERRTRVLERLMAGPATADEVARSMVAERNSTRTALDKLVAERAVSRELVRTKRCRRGVYLYAVVGTDAATIEAARERLRAEPQFFKVECARRAG